ncbi:hypothetical protein N0V93_000898 [Gnomoniopsis smithogilvyi]|uniref:Uncharacterized protein n=1 Tax=Gnomoniopsis smithogilvyi TaxID=1191159 RepID=A0A9W9D0P5_9PEZI|nr:hypothetical protein N0V93_000898 [Gnomoniopsis smithogilvyi]
MSITIPAEWTQPTGCLGSTDVWYWTIISEGTFWGDILGAPTESITCYPPSYTPTIGPAYTAASCPNGFTSGGSANAYSGLWSTVCCPSGEYAMTVRSATFASLFLGCGLNYITDSSTHTLTRTVTIFGHNAASLDSFTWDALSATRVVETAAAESTTVITSGGIAVPMPRTSGDVLYGMAVGVVSPTSTSSQPVSTSTVSTASKSNSSLSPGAAAGIGVGVTFAVIALIAVGAWLCWRHKRRRSMSLVLKKHSPPEVYISPVNGVQHAAPYELQTHERPRELGIQRPVRELE